MQQEQQNPNPLAPFTDDQLIAKYRAVRDVELKKLADDFKAAATPLNAIMELIAGEMHSRLQSRNANHSTTNSGTAYLSEGIKVECIDKAAYLQFCVTNFETWGKDLLTAAAAKETVELFIEKSKTQENPGGTSPPGLKVTYATKCNIRK